MTNFFLDLRAAGVAVLEFDHWFELKFKSELVGNIVSCFLMAVSPLEMQMHIIYYKNCKQAHQITLVDHPFLE